MMLSALKRFTQDHRLLKMTVNRLYLAAIICMIVLYSSSPSLGSKIK